MLFDEILSKYTLAGSFSFKSNESLKVKCNAPRDKAGVYLVFKVTNTEETLIYIGSSGQKTPEGQLKIRKGGIYDRLVNGYHPNKFGERKRIKRCHAFPKQMLAEGIGEIRIYWWVTHEGQVSDFPTDIETLLRWRYTETFQSLPAWHN